MTLENLLSQIGAGTNLKLTDRYSEYAAPVHDHDHHVYYTYEPSASVHGHVGTSKHNYASGHKSGASMSALTLLAFLFFLHILQQCIKDHMTDMSSSQPVVVMTAGREGDEIISKNIANKIDKTGLTLNEDKTHVQNNHVHANNGNKKTNMDHSEEQDSLDKKEIQKLSANAQTNNANGQKYKYVYKNNANRSSYFSKFVNTMKDD